MKNILYLFITSLLFISCSKENPYQEQAVEKLRQTMKNPHAFTADSVIYKPHLLSDEFNQQAVFDSIMISINEESIIKRQETIEEYRQMSYMSSFIPIYQEYIKEYKRDNDSLSQHLVGLTSEINNLRGTESDTIVYHKYTIYYMGQNSFGAMVKGVARVTVSPNGKEINVTDLND
jgi:hypothetical protein